VASYPESRYRSSGLIVEQSVFVATRGFMRAAVGDFTAATRLLRQAQRESRFPSAPSDLVGLALFARDWHAFEQYLHDFLKLYRKAKARVPGDSGGILTIFGMALCRLAIEAGYVPAERPYLPLSLLPNWPGERSSVS